MTDLKCKKPKPCVPPPEPEPTPCSEPFSLEVGDYTLSWDGFCPTVTRTRRTPDGTYSNVTVVNGAITSYGQADVPTYTPPYCSPDPSPCQGGGTGGSAGGGAGGQSVAISPNAGNMLFRASNGLYAHAYVHSGDGIFVTGDGTVNNPYIITAKSDLADSLLKAVIGVNGIQCVTTEGVVRVGLEDHGLNPGVLSISDQFSINRYGLIVEVKKRTEPLIKAGAGLEVTDDGVSLTIGHPTIGMDPIPIVAGGFSMTVNETGHLSDVKRAITITPGIYNLGAYDVDINAFGSITDITQREDVLPKEGTFKTTDGKTFTYDITGRLTSVTYGDEETIAPSPIVDMYTVTPRAGTGSPIAVDVLSYGSPLQYTANDNTITVTLPAYVGYSSQIAINGAESWRVNSAEGTVEIDPKGNDPFTIAFRGGV